MINGQALIASIVTMAYMRIGFQVPTESSVVDELFKHSLSLGILMLVLIMLYREWKDVRAYRKKQDERLLDITADMIKVVEKAHNKFDMLAEDLKGGNEKINRKVNVLLERINNLED